jgi:hypothetical protein
MSHHSVLPVELRAQSIDPAISPSMPGMPAISPLDAQRRRRFAQRLVVLIDRVLAVAKEDVADER